MLASALRLSSLAGSFVLAAAAYRHHLERGDPAYWLAGWFLAVALFIAAVERPAPTGESAARRGGRWLSLALAAIAFATFYHLAPQHGSELAAGCAALTAILAFAFGRWLPFDPQTSRRVLGFAKPAPSSMTRRGWRIGLGVLAVLANVAVMLVNRSSHPAALLLWLASIGLMAAAAWERRRPDDDGDAPADGGPPVSSVVQWVALLAILAIAIALRSIALADYPALVDPDEGRQGGFAEFLWSKGFPDAFGVGWNTFPHIAFMVDYAWVQLLGKSLANLRLASATIGTLAIIPMFFWARRWWGGFVGLVAALVLATNREAIMWSRTGLNNVHQILVAAWMLATFARALQRNRPFDWLWFGVAAGACFHTYHACKLYPVLFAGIGLLLVIGSPGLLRRTAAGAMVGALGFLLTVSPQIVTSVEKWERVRVEGSNRFDVHKLEDAYQSGDVAGVRRYLDRHVGGCLRVLASSWPNSILDPITAVPFFVGLGWMFWYWRDPRNLTTLALLFGILCIGGMVTIYPPWKARLVGMLPAICVIPAVVAGRLRRVAHETLGPRRADYWIAPVLAVTLSASTYVNWRGEFVEWPAIHQGRLMTAICKAITGFGGPGTVLMAGGKDNPPRVALNECFTPEAEGVEIVDLANDTGFAPLPPNHRGAAMVLIPSAHESLLELAHRYLGGASHEIVVGPHGPALHIFRLTPNQVASTRGLAGVVHYDNRPAAPIRAPGPPFTASREHPWGSIEWSGSIHIAAPGSYRLEAPGPNLMLDGRPLDRNQAVVLAAGWHDLYFVTVAGGTVTPLRIQRDGSPWRNVTRAELSPRTKPGGLLRRHFTGAIDRHEPDPIESEPVYSGIEPGISVGRSRRWSDEPNPLLREMPSTTEWVGTVSTDTPHELKLIASSPAQLYLDGRLVLDHPRGANESTALWPAAGTVDFLLRSIRSAEDDRLGNYQMRLLWRPLGGTWTSIVSYALPDSLAELSRVAVVDESEEEG